MYIELKPSFTLFRRRRVLLILKTGVLVLAMEYERALYTALSFCIHSPLALRSYPGYPTFADLAHFSLILRRCPPSSGCPNPKDRIHPPRQQLLDPLPAAALLVVAAILGHLPLVRRGHRRRRPRPRQRQRPQSRPGTSVTVISRYWTPMLRSAAAGVAGAPCHCCPRRISRPRRRQRSRDRGER